MGVRIRMATTTQELDELFQVRHRVFVREKRYFPPVADGRLLDRFDAFPTTANIVALSEGHVVGGVRIVEPSPGGAPADEFFDFGPYLPQGALVGSGSMLVMDEAFRRVPRVTFAMLGMMYYWALCKGLTHITGVAAPEAEKLFLGSGYRPVGERFFHEATQLHALPVVLDIGELNDRFSAFVDKHQFQHFLQSFERQFHQKGEYIIRQGEEGMAAYVIVEGRVGVMVSGGRRSTAPPSTMDSSFAAIPPPPRTPRDAAQAHRSPLPHSSRPPVGAPSGVPGAPDTGPVSVRNPGRMNDSGRMSDAPPSTRNPGRSNAVPTSLRDPSRMSDVPISSREPGMPSSTRSSGPPSTRSGGPPSTRSSGPPSGRSGTPISVREMGPGEVFGELALITAQPRSADVIALTDVDLMVLERDVFYQQVSENPQVALNLLATIGHRLMSVTDRLGEVTDLSYEEEPAQE